MRGIAKISERAAAIEYVPANATKPLNLHGMFERTNAPLEVDLGCGDASFLVALAAEKPDHNFLGIERLFGRVRASCRRIDRNELSNIRIVRADLAQALAHLLAPASVHSFYLMFPDPWPKRRHRSRRVFTPELLASIQRTLALDGTLRVATDQHDYFEQVMQIVTATTEFEMITAADEPPLPRSTFEERYLAAGEEIHRLVLRKVSVVSCPVACQ